MGAWGYDSFENDDALDWLGKLKPAKDTSVLTAAFAAVPDDVDNYLEDREAANAVAAAEVVAALRGKPGPSLPERVAKWAQARMGEYPELTEEARRAVHRVLAASELREIWEDAGSVTRWQMKVDDLLQRLA